MVPKEQILREIRRTAEQNNGKPLGRLRFFTETGIRESDWLGRFWPRWSDALADAGYAPNRLQGAYDERLLCRKYSALARELGRLPVESEIRLKRRTDPTFPSHNTFRRLGVTKGERLRRIAEFCRVEGDYQDVLTWCEEGARPEAERDTGGVQHSRPESGFVYLLKFGRSYKIGRTNTNRTTPAGTCNPTA